MATQYLYGNPLVNTTLILTSTSAITSFAMNASNNAIAAIFGAENVSVHGAITGLIGYCSAITSPPVYRVSLQGVASRGTPDGTVKGGGSPASATFTPSVGLFTVSFANPYTPTTGDLLAAVLDYSSGTIGGSNTATFNARAAGSGGVSGPYPATESAGTWTASQTLPCLAPVYNDGYIGRFFCPVKTVANNTAASTSYGSIWTQSIAGVLTGALVGIRPASGSNVQVTLYEGSSTTIASTTNVSQSQNISCDLAYAATTGLLPFFVPMPSYTLVAGQTYRLVVTNSGTAYTAFITSSFGSQAAIQAAWGTLCGTVGASGTFTDYNSGSDWRSIPVIPCLDSFTEAATGTISLTGGGLVY